MLSSSRRAISDFSGGFAPRFFVLLPPSQDMARHWQSLPSQESLCLSLDTIIAHDGHLEGAADVIVMTAVRCSVTGGSGGTDLKKIES